MSIRLTKRVRGKSVWEVWQNNKCLHRIELHSEEAGRTEAEHLAQKLRVRGDVDICGPTIAYTFDGIHASRGQ